MKGEILKELTKERRFQDNELLMADDTLNFIRCREKQINPLGECLLVEKIMDQLTENEKKILQLYYLDGYRYEEIAKVLQVSVAAIKKRRTRLIKKLRRHLNE